MHAKTHQKFSNVKRRKKNFFKCGVLIIASLDYLLGLGVMTSKAVAIDNAPLESRQLKLLRGQQQSFYQNQQAFSCQSHASPQGVVCYSKLQHQFAPKNYATRSFFGIQNSWIGKKVVGDDVKMAWWGSQKHLAKKVFPTTNFSHPSGTLVERVFPTASYPTKTFYPDAKAQGGLDHDFKKALQQKKTPEQAREFLEKETQ